MLPYSPRSANWPSFEFFDLIFWKLSTVAMPFYSISRSFSKWYTVKPFNNGHQGTKESVRYESVKKDCLLNGVILNFWKNMRGYKIN